MRRAVEITLENDYSFFTDFENSLPLSMLFYTKDSDLILNSINHSVYSFMENHKVDVILISNDKKRYLLLDKLSKYMNIKERSFINLDVMIDTVRVIEKLNDVWTTIETRYSQFYCEGYENIRDYNRKKQDSNEWMPFIVVVIDDIIIDDSVIGEVVFNLLRRIFLKGRAAGVFFHLYSRKIEDSFLCMNTPRDLIK